MTEPTTSWWIGVPREQFGAKVIERTAALSPKHGSATVGNYAEPDRSPAEHAKQVRRQKRDGAN